MSENLTIIRGLATCNQSIISVNILIFIRLWHLAYALLYIIISDLYAIIGRVLRWISGKL